MRKNYLRNGFAGALLLILLAAPAAVSAEEPRAENPSYPPEIGELSERLESDQLGSMLETREISLNDSSIRIQDLTNGLDLVHAMESTVVRDDASFGLLAVDRSDTSQIDQDDQALTRSAAQGAKAARWVYCEGTPHTPHYSNGAGGAIYKVSVRCQRSDSSVNSNTQVNVSGALSFRKSILSKWSTRASSGYTQSVTSKTGSFGPKRTYYIPRSGNGGRGNGQWRTQTYGRIVAPFSSVLESYGQKIIKKKI